MVERILTGAELLSLERAEREAVILSALDQRIVDLNRLTRIVKGSGGDFNSPGTLIALRASIRRLIARAAELDLAIEMNRAA